jgi:hypothetical protein
VGAGAALIESNRTVELIYIVPNLVGSAWLAIKELQTNRTVWEARFAICAIISFWAGALLSTQDEILCKLGLFHGVVFAFLLCDLGFAFLYLHALTRTKSKIN